MIEGSATVDIDRPAADVIAFVLDLERYATVDFKIRRVIDVRPDDGPSPLTGTAVFSGRLRFLPGPVVTTTYTIDRGRSLVFETVPVGVSRFLLDFHGEFLCEPAESGSGCRVTHIEQFSFKPPGKWVVEPLFRTWLRQDTIDEMQRFKAALEA